MNNIIPFTLRLRRLLDERNISIRQFSNDTSIDPHIFYEKNRRYRKATLMAIAYYLGITVEDIVNGTEAADYWYF